MDRTTYDAIANLAQKVGKPAGLFYARARAARNRNARSLYPFDLVTDDGKRLRLVDIRAKVLLLNFFFPT
jgi:cytochrome oxidase Cu insertion factor (SCO1/SenC/PrrC family)